MAELASAIEQIQAAIRKYTTGIKEVPDYPPEDIGDFPFVVCYPNTGGDEWRALNSRYATDNLIIEVHVARKQLPTDIEKVLQWRDAIPAAIKSAELAQELTAIENFTTMTYTFGPMAWGSEETNTLGFRWTLNEVLRTHVY